VTFKDAPPGLILAGHLRSRDPTVFRHVCVMIRLCCEEMEPRRKSAVTNDNGANMRAIVLAASLMLGGSAQAGWDIKTDTVNGEVSTSAIATSRPDGGQPDRVALALGCHRNELSVMLVPQLTLLSHPSQQIPYRVDNQPVGQVTGRNQTGAVLDLDEAPQLIAKLRSGKRLEMRFYAGTVILRPEWSLDGIEQAVAALTKKCKRPS
jgi:hypothetical protein